METKTNTKQEEREAKREAREDAREERDADEHAANELRKQQSHEQELKHQVEKHAKEMEGNPNMEAAQMALLGTVAELLSTIKKGGDVMLVKYAYADDQSIKAKACDLLVRAAEDEGTPEAMQAASERLLEISGVKVPIPSAKGAKAA